MERPCIPDRKPKAYYVERDIFLHFHRNADQLVARNKDGEIQAAVYFFAPGMHELEMRQFFEALRQRLNPDAEST